MFRSWREQAAKLEHGEISKEEYDRWRYKYPELDQAGRWAKIPSQTLSDALIEELKKEEMPVRRQKERVCCKMHEPVISRELATEKSVLFT